MKLRPAHADGRDRAQLLQHPTFQLRGASAHGNPPRKLDHTVDRHVGTSAIAISIPSLRTGRRRGKSNRKRAWCVRRRAGHLGRAGVRAVGKNAFDGTGTVVAPGAATITVLNVGGMNDNVQKDAQRVTRMCRLRPFSCTRHSPNCAICGNQGDFPAQPRVVSTDHGLRSRSRRSSSIRASSSSSMIPTERTPIFTKRSLPVLMKVS